MNTLKRILTIFPICLINLQLTTAQNVDNVNVTTTTITPFITTILSTADNNVNNSSSANSNGTRSTCTRSGLTCLDCQTLQYCMNVNDTHPLYTVTCAEQSSNQNPYCSQQLNQCVTQNTCQQSQVPLLSCSQPGRHPDPMDCTQYIQCIRLANGLLVGYPVKCSDNLNYNHRTQLCGSYPCVEIPNYCKHNRNKIVAYQPYPNIYGKCPNSGDSNRGNILLAMCPNQYTFSERVGQCVPTCQQVGNIPSNEDCHAYYTCGRGLLTGFSIVLNHCPNGFGYNPLTQLCDDAFNNCTNVNN